jgi:hypothetical protein
LTKSHGSNNPVNVVRATIKALESLESLDRVSARRKRDRPVRRPISHAVSDSSHAVEVRTPVTDAPARKRAPRKKAEA